MEEIEYECEITFQNVSNAFVIELLKIEYIFSLSTIMVS